MQTQQLIVTTWLLFLFTIPTCLKGEQVQSTNENLRVAPVFLQLRQLLYSDRGLKEVANEIPEVHKALTDALRNDPNYKGNIPELHKAITDAVVLIRAGNPKQANIILESAKDTLKGNRDYWILLAYAKQQLGDNLGARSSIRQVFTLPDSESRDLLSAWSILRELGETAHDSAAKEVLGVIIEIGVEDSAALVAGYADGSARLFYGSGGGIMIPVEETPKKIREGAQQLTRSAQPLVSQMPLEKDRQLPKSGRIRFVVLTGAGIHVAEENLARGFVLEDKKSKLNQVWAAVNKLITGLREFDSRTKKQ